MPCDKILQDSFDILAALSRGARGTLLGCLPRAFGSLLRPGYVQALLCAPRPFESGEGPGEEVGAFSSPAFFASVVELSLFLVPVLFLSTGRGTSCAWLWCVVSAAPQPPRTAGVLVGPFFRKLETFLPCHEMLRRDEPRVREKNLRQSTLKEKQKQKHDSPSRKHRTQV